MRCVKQSLPGEAYRKFGAIRYVCGGGIVVDGGGKRKEAGTTLKRLAQTRFGMRLSLLTPSTTSFFEISTVHCTNSIGPFADHILHTHLYPSALFGLSDHSLHRPRRWQRCALGFHDHYNCVNDCKLLVTAVVSILHPSHNSILESSILASGVCILPSAISSHCSTWSSLK